MTCASRLIILYINEKNSIEAVVHDLQVIVFELANYFYICQIIRLKYSWSPLQNSRKRISMWLLFKVEVLRQMRANKNALFKLALREVS